jgi:BCD family chlorophyll transporter-like MFS transporter
MKQMARVWQVLGPSFLPFADAASVELPLGRLLRLSLFQVSVGMAMVLLTGTLNRVMIVELGVPAWLVGLMVSAPLLFAPFRALIGHRSDMHRSVLGWRRVPYIWFGTLMQFGGFAIMPFALILLSGDSNGPDWIGQAGAALAFLLVGAGIHTTQTAGLALANDLAPAHVRPRVVALLYVTLLLAMVASAALFSELLRDFSQIKLIQVIQGVAVVSVMLNCAALWKQEARNPLLTSPDRRREGFMDAINRLLKAGRVARLLTALGFGTFGFAMQDILLEPFGGQVFGMNVGETTWLTALLAMGTLAGFGISARLLTRGSDPCRVASAGALLGAVAFACVIFAPAIGSANLFRCATVAIGFGSGLFAVGMLTLAMEMADASSSGLALGAWGAVQATATGLAVAFSGVMRDAVASLALAGTFGPALQSHATGYSFVYYAEILLLFVTLVLLGPLVRVGGHSGFLANGKFGLAQHPG